MENKRQRLNNYNEFDNLGLGGDKSDIGTKPESLIRIEGEVLCQQELQHDEKLRDLLKTWNCTDLYDILIDEKMNYDNLKSVKESDYSQLFRKPEVKFGDLINFRNGHIEWKKSAICPKTQNQNVDLEMILKHGGESAVDITNYFKTNSHLNDSLREQLVDLVIKDRELTRAMMSNLADQICIIFPGEKKEVYYNHERGKNPSGMLYVRYCQSRTNNYKARSEESEVIIEESVEDLLTDEVQLSIDFVNDKNNIIDLTQTSMLFDHWRASFTYRYSKKYTMAEALNEWPVLQENDGIFMVLDDFLTKYGSETANSLKNNWNDFIFKNFRIISEGIKHPIARRDLLQSQSQNDVNIRDRTVLMAFHNLHYLVPTKFATKTKTKTWTPSIPQSKDAFLIMANNSHSITDKMNVEKALSIEKGFADHPIVIEMRNKESVEYFVGVCTTRYAFSTFIEAVDAAFKFYIMFNIPFPPQCKKVWMFLNQIFYKIDLGENPNFKSMSILDSFQL